jgi:hypothetical protein
MVTYTIILLLLLAVTIMPMNLENRFTQDELAEMGIRLDSSSITEAR